jgi:DNA invertase Pin-like site-specific DNA recombinase
MVFALGLAAKIERTAINERIAAARVRVEAAGGSWGRPKSITPATLERARALRDKGRTFRAIALALKVKRSTIARALAG